MINVACAKPKSKGLFVLLLVVLIVMCSFSSCPSLSSALVSEASRQPTGPETALTDPQVQVQQCQTDANLDVSRACFWVTHKWTLLVTIAAACLLVVQSAVFAALYYGSQEARQSDMSTSLPALPVEPAQSHDPSMVADTGPDGRALWVVVGVGLALNLVLSFVFGCLGTKVPHNLSITQYAIRFTLSFFLLQAVLYLLWRLFASTSSYILAEILGRWPFKNTMPLATKILCKCILFWVVLAEAIFTVLSCPWFWLRGCSDGTGLEAVSTKMEQVRANFGELVN